MFNRVLGVCLLLSGCAARPAPSPASAQTPATDESSLLANAALHERTGDTARAEQYLLAAWDRGAPLERVLPRLLEVCFEAGRLQNALFHLERARRQDPEDAGLAHLHAELLFALGRKYESLEVASQVTELEGAPADAYFLLGRLLLDLLGDRAAADVAFESYLRLAPTGRHRAWARSLLAQGRTS